MQKECFPLKITNELSRKYPQCWDQVEDLRAATDVPKWDRICYIPIAGTLAITSNQIEQVNDAVIDAAIMAAIAPWRIYKQIYTFAEETERLLLDQADDCKIPIETLRNLPYPCIYIQVNKVAKVDGFFAHIEYDVNNGTYELRMTLVMKDGRIMPMTIHLIPGKTIYDGILEAKQQSIENLKKLPQREFYYKRFGSGEGFEDYAFGFLAPFVQLILYICAQNSEIEADPEQEKIYRVPKSREFIKDKYREIKKYNCGEITAKIIRGIDSQAGTNFTYVKHESSGTPKRPHVRRGHWHHRWTGRRDDPNRKLILKWQPPTFIHRNEAKDMMEKLERENDNS